MMYWLGSWLSAGTNKLINFLRHHKYQVDCRVGFQNKRVGGILERDKNEEAFLFRIASPEVHPHFICDVPVQLKGLAEIIIIMQ